MTARPTWVRKLYLTLALQESRRGFIRLSEVELDSYIKKHYLSPKTDETAALLSDTQLTRGEVELLNQDINWTCWMRKKLAGRWIDLVWQRTVELTGAPTNWSFELKAMRVGRIEVPPRFWPLVQRQLGHVDLAFTNQFDWLAHLPTLEIKTNEMVLGNELRLYTYPVAGSSIEEQSPSHSK